MMFAAGLFSIVTMFFGKKLSEQGVAPIVQVAMPVDTTGLPIAETPSAAVACAGRASDR